MNIRVLSGLRAKCAFSLIELLVTLIIMSLLISAFMPVVTKKLKSSAAGMGGSGNGGFSSDLLFSAECEKFSTEEYKCMMCSKTACTLCSTQLSTTTGYYVDPAESCTPKNCVDKFGSNCMDCKKDACTACIPGSSFNSETNECEACEAGYYSTGGLTKCEKCQEGFISNVGSSSCKECSANKHQTANADGTICIDKFCGENEYIDGATCKPCPNGTYQPDDKHQKLSCTSCPSECKSCTTAEICTECAAGYTLNAGRCTLGCDPKTVTLSGTNTKVTQYNMGDDPSCSRDVIESMAGITFVPVGTTCSGELCCWYGTTAVGSTCTNVGGLYSGCNRTVCKWFAAKKICESIGKGWKLPDTSNSMANWYPANSKAASGLMLCDNSASSASASKCAYVASCPGSYNGNCRPHHVWARSESGGAAQYRHLNGGTWNENTHDKSHAFGVRCVKE